MDTRNVLRYRIAPLEMTPSEFRKETGETAHNV